MTFNINEFRSNIDKNLGLYKPNLFAIQLNWVPPQIATDKLYRDETRRDLVFLSESANLPGLNISTTDFYRQGFGIIEKRATKPGFPAATVNFLLDNNGIVFEYFHKWTQYIVSFQSGEGTINGVTKGYPGQVGYFDDYASTITIRLLSETGAAVVEYTLHDAFPTVIGDVGLGWKQNDEVATLPVTFHYRYWTSTFFEPGIRPEAGGGMSLLQLFGKLHGAYEIIRNTKRPRSVSDAIQVLNNGSILLDVLKS